MNRSEVKAEVESSFGYFLTNIQDGTLRKSTDFGSFFSSVENFDRFSIIQRNFETAGEPIDIPYSCNEPGVQMIFSLDGQSVFNDRSNPFVLSPVSHCINLFKPYDCSNLLEGHTKQHDVSFCLKKSFYCDLIAGYLSSSDDRLPAMIFNQEEFNTINEHIPADAAVLGILKNIMECPFMGSMKSTFIQEHLRALFTLQLFHFNKIVDRRNARLDSRINRRDEDTLQDIKKYIDQNYLDPASLDSLSRHFGINEFKLKHGFKLLFNTSPMKYLQFKRLEFSRFLLRSTDKTIKCIAVEIGYSHAANFTIAFNKAFGNSPLDYRTRGLQVNTKGDGETQEMESYLLKLV